LALQREDIAAETELQDLDEGPGDEIPGEDEVDLTQEETDADD